MNSKLGSSKFTRILLNTILMLIIFGTVFFGVMYFLRLKNDQIQQLKTSTQPFVSRSILGKPFPKYELIDLEGNALNYKKIYNGNVIIIVVNNNCSFCKDEAKFLRSRISKYTGVKFIGILAFGSILELKSMKSVFPFEIFNNPDGKIIKELYLRGVPTKLFIKDGYVRKIMEGATVVQNKE